MKKTAYEELEELRAAWLDLLDQLVGGFVRRLQAWLKIRKADRKPVCAGCGGPLAPESDIDAMTVELEENFPGWDPQDCDIVCDDCYQEIMGLKGENEE